MDLRNPAVRLSLLAWVILVLPSLTAHAEDRHDGAFWFVSQLGVPLGERLSLHVMVQNRVTEDFGTYERTVVRPWLGVALPKGFDVALGYDAHIFENPLDVLENRAWQRIAYQHDFGDVRGFAHFWLEQRFFDRSSEVALRGRFQIGGLLELPRDFGLVVRNEFYVNLTETDVIRRTGLRENQFFAGVNRPFGRRLRLEMGYLMQYRDLPRFDLFNHTLVFGVAVQTPQLWNLF